MQTDTTLSRSNKNSSTYVGALPNEIVFALGLGLGFRVMVCGLGLGFMVMVVE